MAKQHYCIEPDCDKEVSGEGRRCVQCAARNPERRAKVSKGVKQAWIDGIYGEEWQQKQSKAQKDAHIGGAYDSEEYSQKLSCALEKRWEPGGDLYGAAHLQNPITRGKMSRSAITRHTREFENLERNPERLYQDKTWLEKRYWEDMCCPREMAEEAGCAPCVILRWMRKYSILRREEGAARQLWYIQHRDEIRQVLSERLKAAWKRGDFDTEETQQKRLGAVLKRWEPGGDLHGAEHLHTPEAHNNMSQGQKQRHENPEERRKNSERIKAAWARGDYDGVFQSPTSIELELMAALDICGIEHESQYRPDGCSYIFDEYIPEASLFLEADGDFWHYSEWAIERGAQERAARRDAWATENGYKLLHISESNFKEYGAWSIVLREVVPFLGSA